MQIHYNGKNVKEESTSLYTWEHESFLFPNVQDSEVVFAAATHHHHV